MLIIIPAVFPHLIQDLIFSKLGMNNSFLNAKKAGKRLVKGLDKDGKVTANWDLSSMVSAGGILSNVEDLSKYGTAHFDKSNIELGLLKKKDSFIK